MERSESSSMVQKQAIEDSGKRPLNTDEAWDPYSVPLDEDLDAAGKNADLQLTEKMREWLSREDLGR